MYPLVPVGATNRDKRSAQPFVSVGGTNRDKRLHFCPGWCLQPGQKAHIPPLARLAVGPGTKATFCPGPKGSRDKWLGTKACSVVVNAPHLFTFANDAPFNKMIFPLSSPTLPEESSALFIQLMHHRFRQ